MRTLWQRRVRVKGVRTSTPEFKAVRAEEEAKMKVIGKWDAGASYDAIAHGNYLYVASGSQVRIYDISTKEKIENIKMECIHSYGYREYGTYKEKTPPVNILHTDAGTIRGLYADGNYLYVIGDKFVIADISDPENAYIVSSLDIGGKDVHVQGNYAYLTTPNPYGDDITIVDISDKKNPVKVSGINVDEIGGDWRGIWRLYVEGNYLYTGDNNNYLYIINISDPTNPTVVSKWPNPGGYREASTSFAKKDNYVFVTRWYHGFFVIDVSDPANPVEVARVGMEYANPAANDIKIFGDYLFVSTRYEGFRIYNVSDPTNPTLITKFGGFVSYAEGIFVHEMPYGTYVFETGFSDGWIIINVTDIEQPKLMTWPWMPVPVGDSIKVKGNYAFIGGHNAAVWVLNVSDPANPKPIVVMINGGRNTGLEISEDGNYLYVAASWSGLCIANISDPENPKWEIIDYGPNIDGTLIAVDNYLYQGGLNIYDVSDPKNPELVYSEKLFGEGYKRVIARYGNDYLIGAGEEGVFIVDISNRTNPVIVGKVSLPEKPNVDILAGRPGAVSGSVVYVGADNHLYSIDISDPTNPVILDKVYTGGTNSVVIYGTYAYSLPRVASWGFRVVDISDPSNMKVVETRYDLGGNDMDEENGLLYTSSGHIISPVGGKLIKATVTIKNANNRPVTARLRAVVFYAESLSDSTGDPAKDYANWSAQADATDVVEFGPVTLDPGESITASASNIPLNIWAEGTKIDAGVVLLDADQNFYDSLKVSDVMEV